MVNAKDFYEQLGRHYEEKEKLEETITAAIEHRYHILKDKGTIASPFPSDNLTTMTQKWLDSFGWELKEYQLYPKDRSLMELVGIKTYQGTDEANPETDGEAPIDS